MDYKKSLNLPRTSFDMKANLVEREPQMQKRWDEMDIYALIRRARKDATVFTMHDGPPYANGGVHIGTGMNKILKDIVVKYFTLQGYNAPYIPGWDCHGLPIEHKIMTEIRTKKEDVSAVEIRSRCRAYAERFIEVQRNQFKALGVFGDWYKPYMTFTPEYESGVIEVFRRMYERGFIARALKPIHWCSSCETALAEAELEYSDEVGPSIFVLFPDAQGLDKAFGVKLDAPTFVLIWTTTPWTLPANLAVAVNPSSDYSLVRFSTNSVADGYTFIGSELLESLRQSAGFVSLEVVATAKGKDLVGVTYAHPFMQRRGAAIGADFVTMSDGTGIVHIAPGHGTEDYLAGLENGLPIFSPVDARGCFTSDVPLWQGLGVHDADPQIIKHLADLGALVSATKMKHSYPHCWRCKSPVIFRATPQWFVRVENDGLREKLLKAIADTRWVPEWGQGRIGSMVAQRPDWCISRQRVWGVMIPAFYCTECNEPLISNEILAAVQDFVSKRGADGFFACDPAEVLPIGTKCGKCGGANFKKESDIFDVWFESGSSFRSVVMAHPELSFPADVYLEGTDQHRGWFQLSLLPAMAAYGEKPFKTVVTHGFIVDEWGQKLSKSRKKEDKYDVTAAHDCVRVFGADVVRLWISSVDYREDVLFSEEVVRKLNASYFALRNCFRFMLGNLDGFTANEMLPYDKLATVDKWVLAELVELEKRARRHYEDFEFHRFYSAFKTFCDVTLSSDYFDILKDRLYCDSRGSDSYRAARTVLYHLCSAMARMISPILVHTAEEIWEHLRGMLPVEQSVHLALWPKMDERWVDEQLRVQFERLFEVRYEVRKRIEELRAAGSLRRSEEAAVELHSSSNDLSGLLFAFKGDLPALFKTASVAVLNDKKDNMAVNSVLPELSLAVGVAPYEKCARCWNHYPSVGTHADMPELCDRCYAVVAEMGD